MKYRPEIDGLRAIAVMVVIVFHSGFSMFSGGFVGVDVFFVISGFLITSIIFSDLKSGEFSFVKFYERRIRRILPMAFFTLLLTVILSWFLLLPAEMESVSKSILAVTGFFSNFLFWQESNYWDLDSDLKPLLHTWSLAVEEQFYLLFPLLLVATKNLHKSQLVYLFASITLISLIIAQLASTFAPTANFYLLSSRVWELAIGALTGILVFRFPDIYQRITSRNSLNDLVSLVGLCMVVFAVFAFDEHTPFPSVYALIPTLGCSLILIFCSPSGLIGRVLSVKPMVQIGLVSYSAYLWHQPLFAFLRFQAYPEPTNLQFLFVIVLIFPLAFLTWKFIETPFRDKRKIGRKAIFKFAILGSLPFILFGAMGIHTHGYPNRNKVNQMKVRKYQANNKELKDNTWRLLEEKSGDSEYRVEYNAYDQELWFDPCDGRDKLLLIGNSHSKDLYNTLLNSDSCTKAYQLARYGCQIHQLSQDDHKLYSSINYVRADIVMIVSRYSDQDREAFDMVIQKILRDGKRVALVKNIFEFPLYGTRTLADVHVQEAIYAKSLNNHTDFESIVEVIELSYFQKLAVGNQRPEDNTEIERLTQIHDDLIVMDRTDYICDRAVQKCFAINSGLEKFYFDQGHHTIAGVRFFGKRIDEINWLEPLSKLDY